MNQQLIPDDPKTHVIITYSKGIYFITQKQNERIGTLGLDSEIIIDGNTVKLRAISEIQTVEKYNELNPTKNINTHYSDNSEYNKILKEKKSWSTDRYIRESKNALQGIIKGLKRYINSSNYKGTEKPKELLKHMELKLNFK